MYQQGKIYKIYNDELCYYGSTTKNLKLRLRQHINAFNSNKVSNSESCKIIQTGNYKIELVENFPCNTKRELLDREGYYIKNNTCINKVVIGRTKKESNRVYRLKNKDAIKKQSIDYRKNNRDKLNEKQRIYMNNNKELIKKKKKRLIICDCGNVIQNCVYYKHIKSKKHNNYIKNPFYNLYI